MLHVWKLNGGDALEVSKSMQFRLQDGKKRPPCQPVARNGRGLLAAANVPIWRRTIRAAIWDIS